jgi:tetratricopeptide (TPR) repeat protein
MGTGAPTLAAMVVTMFSPSQFYDPSGRPEPDLDDIQRLARRAASLAGSGDTSGAMRTYQLALLMDESRADLWFQYGMLQYRVRQFADSVESFEFALRQDPGHYAARYRLARVCYESGRPLEALAQFRLVTQQRPGYIPAWRYVVQITWALGDLGEAEAQAVRGLHHAPDDVELASMLAQIVQDRCEARA